MEKNAESRSDTPGIFIEYDFRVTGRTRDLIAIVKNNAALKHITAMAVCLF